MVDESKRCKLPVAAIDYPILTIPASGDYLPGEALLAPVDQISGYHCEGKFSGLAPTASTPVP